VGGYFGTYALVDFVFWPRIPAELVGTWRVVEGPQQGVILKFDRNGAFEARIAVGDEGAIVRALAELDETDDKVLRISSTNPHTGRTTTKKHIIRSLTENSLLLEDPTGSVSSLVRQK
jgi:hypothetical protein